jgi:WD40 repeat protein
VNRHIILGTGAIALLIAIMCIQRMIVSNDSMLQQRSTFRINGQIEAVNLSADGSVVAVTYLRSTGARHGTVRNALTIEELWTEDLRDNLPIVIALSDDGSILAIAEHGRFSLEVNTQPEKRAKVRIISLRNRTERGEFTIPRASIQTMVFDPRGDFLAIAGTDGLVQVFDLHQSRVVKMFDESEFDQGHVGSHAATFSLSGRRIAIAVDRTIRVFDLDSAAWQRTLEGHTHTVTGLDFGGTDDQLLFSIGNDNSVRIWNVEKGLDEQRLTHEYTFEAGEISVLFGGKSIATCGKSAVDLGKFARGEDTPVSTSAAIIELKTGKAHLLISPNTRLTDMAFAQCAKSCVVGDDIGEVRIWDIRVM